MKAFHVHYSVPLDIKYKRDKNITWDAFIVKNMNPKISGYIFSEVKISNKKKSIFIGFQK